jgi:hypothetical protein
MMMRSKFPLVVYGGILAAATPVLLLAAKLPRQAAGDPQSTQVRQPPVDAQAEKAAKAFNVPQPTTYREYLELWHNPGYHSQTVEKQALAEPFKGVTTNGKLVPGLFSIKSTGVSTEPVRKAAEAFLASLTPEERKRTMFAMSDDQWRKWENIDDYYRQGVAFFEMTDAQKEAGFNLMRAGLSAKGLKLSRDIMKLNYTLGELGHNLARLGDENYFITLMGTPSAKDPWGWKVDGHHLAINYFVLGDQVVMSPAFFGAEPAIAKSGKYAGTQAFQAEQSKGLAMIRALTEEQRQQAVIKTGPKIENQNVGEAFKDNIMLDYAGVPVSSFSTEEKKQLVDLIAQYVGNMDDGHAKIKMAEVEEHLDQTYFAWIGGSDPDSVFYYRIHSPVILIEFDHQQPIGLRGPEFDRSKPTQLHIHTVVRTPNGNDYGKDLLRQHYLENPGTHAE